MGTGVAHLARQRLCAQDGGVCVTALDGYYVESVVCVLLGLSWWLWLGKRMRSLQDKSPSAWQCPKTR
ncbi:hypothetical protein AGOR_G00243840 [Albula goreensis]|uniref:Uncharacterized protein n=1 Tax=Albula goreensis TaxID=1534307 RepID=A0A8T3CFD4_9TELE|nr:hypothetical protein AGOR_G00243840 [Albula goreensis]